MGAPSAVPVPPENRTPNRGRPSIYSDEMARQLCAGVAQGLSIKTICDRYPDRFPPFPTVYRWLVDNKSDYFSQLYRRAKNVADEMVADTMLELADEATTRENANAVKVRLGARQWWLSKRRPEVYGDFVHLYHKHEQTTKVEVTLVAPEWLQGLIAPPLQQDAQQGAAPEPQVIDVVAEPADRGADK